MPNRLDTNVPGIIVALLLAIIWTQTSFTVFLCLVIVVLISKLVSVSQNNENINNSQISNSSPSVNQSQSEDIPGNNNISSSILQNNENQLSSGIEVAQADVDNTSSIESREPQVNEIALQPDASQSELVSILQQMPEESAQNIDDIIASDERVAISVAIADENELPNNNSVMITTPPTTAGATSDNTETNSASNDDTTPVTVSDDESAPKRSAFVTDNVMKIAVSYSGKERKRVLKITRILQGKMKTPESPYPVFFDKDFQHEICRINGLNHLFSIYKQAQLVVVFLSPTYADSRYCTGEWRTIAQRFLTTINNKEATQLLLVKLGQYDMNQLGLVENDFSLNGDRMSNQEIAEIIKRRWDAVEKNMEN